MFVNISCARTRVHDVFTSIGRRRRDVHGQLVFMNIHLCSCSRNLPSRLGLLFTNTASCEKKNLGLSEIETLFAEKGCQRVI